jgi:hypothetical protein
MPASRTLFQFQGSFERELVHIYALATVGSSGAITLSSANSRGVASITKESGAGDYTILLQNTYSRLMQVTVSQELAGAAGSTAPNVMIEDESVASDKTIELQFHAADGTTEANPASGTILRIHIVLSNVAKT